MITPLKVSVIPGVGPATTERLARLGVETVSQLQKLSVNELVREFGRVMGEGLHELAFARDDRLVQHVREVKSISMEDTFAVDITDRAELAVILARDARAVAERLTRKGLFARTIGIKVRHADFSTWSRSRTLNGATDNPERIGQVAIDLLREVQVADGVRLVGVGVSNLTDSAQEELFWEPDAGSDEIPIITQAAPVMRRRHGNEASWVPGMDVSHDDHGRGWVWGAGHGIVTVRFETRHTGVGPVRSLRADDPALHVAAPLMLAVTRSAQQAEFVNEDQFIVSSGSTPDGLNPG